jgi:hypothetical protein
MKKLVLFILLFLVISCPAFAEYKPIPKELSIQYKNEVNKLLNKKYNSTIKEINKISKNAERMYIKALKNKDLYMDFATKNYDTNIFIPVFDMLSDIITITQKYTNSKLDVPATDSYVALYEFLLPYFIDNEICMDKINNIQELSVEKYKIIEEYYIKSHKFMYPNEN